MTSYGFYTLYHYTHYKDSTRLLVWMIEDSPSLWASAGALSPSCSSRGAASPGSAIIGTVLWWALIRIC